MNIGSQYTTRDNFIGTWLGNSYIDLSITRNDYFSRTQPALSEELVNRVEVATQPLKPETSLSTTYTTNELIELEPSESYTLIAEYSSPPVLTTGAISSITGSVGGLLTILSSTYYPWGAEVIVENNTLVSGSANVKIEGYALSVQGKITVTSEDADAISTDGLQKYEYPENHLIQSAEMAQQIADSLLASYKEYRKDVSLNWRGNPCLELGDMILVPEYERGNTKVESTFKVYKNQLNYDGTLTQLTEGRKI